LELAWRFFTAKREWLAQYFCQPIYESWLIEAVSSGRIQAPGFIDGDPAIRAAYSGTHWIGAAPGQKLRKNLTKFYPAQ
jgi:capsid protein